jgi:hypothetical protein
VRDARPSRFSAKARSIISSSVRQLRQRPLRALPRRGVGSDAGVIVATKYYDFHTHGNERRG